MMRNPLGKIINIGSLLFMVIFTPLTLGVVVSANSLPGDTMYPLKISLESMAVFLSQVNPKVEMEVRLVVLNRRYREAKELLKESGSARGYKYFNSTAADTNKAVLGIRNRKLQDRYKTELAKDLRRYNEELDRLIQQLEAP